MSDPGDIDLVVEVEEAKWSASVRLHQLLTLLWDGTQKPADFS